MTPISLFFFLNVLFFLFSPISDYSLSLYEQTRFQPYHKTAANMVNTKLKVSGLSYAEYEAVYNRTSDNISKALIILNVPIIALFVWAVSFRRRPYFYDSLIFSFHFFTVLMFSVVIGYLLFRILDLLVISSWAENAFMLIFGLILPLMIAFIAFKRFLKSKYSMALLAAAILFTGTLATQFIYRMLIFLITYAAT